MAGQHDDITCANRGRRFACLLWVVLGVLCIVAYWRVSVQYANHGVVVTLRGI